MYVNFVPWYIKCPYKSITKYKYSFKEIVKRQKVNKYHIKYI